MTSIQSASRQYSRYASRIALGLGYSVLPDYLCKEWIAENRLTLVLKPALAVTNHTGLTQLA